MACGAVCMHPQTKRQRSCDLQVLYRARAWPTRGGVWPTRAGAWPTRGRVWPTRGGEDSIRGLLTLRSRCPDAAPPNDVLPE